MNKTLFLPMIIFSTIVFFACRKETLDRNKFYTYPLTKHFVKLDHWGPVIFTWSETLQKMEWQGTYHSYSYEDLGLEDYKSIRPETYNYDFGIEEFRFFNEYSVALIYKDSTKLNDTLTYSFKGAYTLVLNGFIIEPYLGVTSNSGCCPLYFDIMYYKYRKLTPSGTTDSEIKQRLVSTISNQQEIQYICDSLNLGKGDIMMYVYDRFSFN